MATLGGTLLTRKTITTLLVCTLAIPSAFAGSIFIANRGQSTGDLFQFTQTGTLIQSISGNGLVNGQGVVLGPNGNLLVVSESTGNVLQYNPNTGAYIGVFATTNKYPQPILVGPDGNVYVGASSTVERFDGLTGASLGVFATDNRLSSVSGLAFDATGNLFVSDGNAGDILKFSNTGALLSTFATGIPPIVSGAGALLFNGPNLLVAATFAPAHAGWGNQILAFAPNGNQLSDFASGANLLGPDNMAFGPDGLLYIVNYAGGNVVRYTAGGQFVDTFIPNGPGSMRGIAFVNDASPAPSGVPEPSSVALAAAGLLTMAALRSRKRPQ